MAPHPSTHDPLRSELRALAERVAALEAAATTHAPIPNASAPASPTADSSASTPDTDTFWALSGLSTRRAEHPETAPGAVMLVGSLTLPTGAPVAWQQAAGTEALLDGDWSDLAPALAALGHPVRLEILRRILTGTRTTAALTALAELGTSGQLHHHLRQLVSTGWVRQAGRGAYDVPAARVVPLLTCMVGAER